MKKFVIKPSYYDNFKCLKDACPNLCCKDWKINIDAKTLKKYNKIEDKDFCNFVVGNIDTYTNNIILNKKICPFLDDDCLCKIQKKYNENYLSKTCKTFPRFIQKNKEVIRHDLYLSCPNTFNLLVKFHNQNKYLKSMLNLPFNKNLIDFIKFQLKTNKKYKFNKTKQYQSLYNFINNLNSKPQKYSFDYVANFYKNLQQIFNNLNFSIPSIIKLKTNKAFLNYFNLSKTEQQTFKNSFKKFNNKYKKMLSIVFDYYLNYFIFKATSNSTLAQNFYKAICLYHMCKLVLFLSYITQNKSLDFPFLVSSFSKAIEHSNSLNTIVSKIKDLF